MRAGLLTHAQTARAEDVKAADVTSCFALRHHGDAQTIPEGHRKYHDIYSNNHMHMCVFFTPHSLSADISVFLLQLFGRLSLRSSKPVRDNNPG